ncbi:MAG TPA: hypothetical protein PLB00_13620 [Pseudomonadota bacterium]|nr:hypothetical protein [Pseudomonadota bacterium]
MRAGNDEPAATDIPDWLRVVLALAFSINGLLSVVAVSGVIRRIATGDAGLADWFIPLVISAPIGLLVSLIAAVALMMRSRWREFGWLLLATSLPLLFVLALMVEGVPSPG